MSDCVKQEKKQQERGYQAYNWGNPWAILRTTRWLSDAIHVIQNGLIVKLWPWRFPQKLIVGDYNIQHPTSGTWNINIQVLILVIEIVQWFSKLAGMKTWIWIPIMMDSRCKLLAQDKDKSHYGVEHWYWPPHGVPCWWNWWKKTDIQPDAFTLRVKTPYWKKINSSLIGRLPY